MVIHSDYLNSFTSNDRVQGTTNIEDGEEHFITALYDGTNIILYFDGVEDVRVTPTGTYGGSIFDYKIGDGLENWGGSIRDFNIYRKASLEYK